jgi:tight adherence protein C
MTETLGLLLIFLAVAGLCFTGVQVMNRRRQRLQARLEAGEKDSTPELILGGLTPALGQIPMDVTGLNDLQRDLLDAGFYRPTALMEYRAVRTVLMVVPLLAGGILTLLVPPPDMPYMAFLSLMISALGFSLPRLYLRSRARARARDIERGLPVAVDLLTLGLSGGQNILSALHRVSRELRHSFPTLSQELEIVARQSELRSLQHALQQLAERVRVPEVRNLALILVQSERLGSDISAALLEFSTNFRITMKSRAEGQANRASFWMVFPTIFCMWLPAAVLLSVPVYYEFWHRREAARDIVLQRRERVQEASKKRDNARREAISQSGTTLP